MVVGYVLGEFGDDWVGGHGVQESNLVTLWWWAMVFTMVSLVTIS